MIILNDNWKKNSLAALAAKRCHEFGIIISRAFFGNFGPALDYYTYLLHMMEQIHAIPYELLYRHAW
jgi:hypothetical protein